MRKILKEVQDGTFAKEWLEEYEAGQPNMNQLREENKNHLIEKTGQKLREMMSWVKK